MTNSLNDFFDSEDLDEEAMYFIEMHGFLTSLVIQPSDLSQAQIVKEILAESTANTDIKNAIFELKKEIEQQLLSGEFPDTLSAAEDEDSLTLWAAGFMQGVFSQEAVWFATHPEEVAELTLPIISCSGLLDDDMGDISQNEDILDDMAEKIPDCVIDLYLLFNSIDSA
ncbi:MAG: metal-binding protein [Cycloclasticus sp. symbiont of Bathymodiolus heckerae]|nr:MAG: metal-binding protein [Cycloclasticus sp. symbiont of Bathymodiolus heckerae]